MRIKTIKFLKSAAKVSDFPDYQLPEFAFFGRSNVGKSSLINMLVGRKSLVKVGSKPGVTKLINFFLINDNISLADMPGFGYAKIPKNIRDRFLPLIKNYINNRDNLRIGFLLVDIRRTPTDPERKIVMELTRNNKPAAIDATKCDKLSKNQRIINVKKIAREFMIESDSIFFSSSKTGEGRDDILRLMEEFGR
jgi:GTP-binding protein